LFPDKKKNPYLNSFTTQQFFRTLLTSLPIPLLLTLKRSHTQTLTQTHTTTRISPWTCQETKKKSGSCSLLQRRTLATSRQHSEVSFVIQSWESQSERQSALYVCPKRWRLC